MDTSLLEQELEPLNAQIEETRAKIETLEDDLRVVEAELDTFSDDKQRFDILREVCEGLDKLDTLGAGELFWSGVAEAGAAAGHLEQVREQVARFEKEFQIVERRRQGLSEQADRCQEALDYLFEEVHDAFAREERRLEEFAIVRDISPVAHGPGIMPWAKVCETERRFRKMLLISLLCTLLFGILIPLIDVPIPDRVATVVEIPERLATLVKKEPPKPEPQQRRKPELAKSNTPKSDNSAKAAKPDKSPSEAQPKGGTKLAKGHGRPAGGGGGGGSPGSRRVRTTGVLAFKASFADIMDEVPVARLGTEARLNKNSEQAAGQAVAHRSLVASQAKSGGSGGISNFGVSRNLGNGGSGGGTGYGRGGGQGSGNGTGWGDGSGVGYGGTGMGVGKVKSAVAGLSEEAGRPLSDGPGPGRTDEEIQIVFDRYKATLYRIYNRKLREDPTLRGKLLLRLTIEPDGEVSMCEAESTDLASPELVAQIVARVKRFNFGAKEGVPSTTILYPIDFLPAG